MQSGSFNSITGSTDSNFIDDSARSEWAPPKSPTFLMTSPFASTDSFNVVNNKVQMKRNLSDPDNARLWNPPDDKIFSGSTDSDNSVSYRDLNQPCVTNVHVSQSPLPHVAPCLPIGSPSVTEKKWMPQSPESSRFFNAGGGQKYSIHLAHSFDNLDNRDNRIAFDSSPNAVAVNHSPLDLSFPVKDTRSGSDCLDTLGSPSLGLGIAQGQRRGSHGDHPITAYAPNPHSVPGRFAGEGVSCPSPSAKSCFDLLTQERQGFDSLNEVNGFTPAPFPSLSSTQPPGSPFKGINEQQEHPYNGYEVGNGVPHGNGNNGNGFIKGGLQPLDESLQLQSLQKRQGQYSHGGLPLQIHANQDYPPPQGHNQCDAFSMDSMQHSLRAANVTSPFSQQQQQYINQQTLPPRSPQMQPLMPHQQPQYFSPGRGRSNSSPITTNAFPHLATVSEYHSHNMHGPNSAYSTMPGSPYIENSRGPSPVSSEYSYGCGSGGFNNHHNPQGSQQGSQPGSQQGSIDGRHSQRQSPQHSNDSHMQFTSIDQQTQPYEGCIYQVQFKRSHRCLILSPSATQGIKPGDFVIVEADRGEDLGVVVSMAPRDSPLAATIFAACSSSMRGPDSEFLKKILRVASMQERVDLPMKAQEEAELLEVCRERAREMYSLPMSLVDAEYQFDRHKLILYYSASRRIDFREFVRDLFAIYKTRIWMEQATAHHSFRPSETAARALATGVLHQHHSPLTLPPSASNSVGNSVVGSPSAANQQNGGNNPFGERKLDGPGESPHRRESYPSVTTRESRDSYPSVSTFPRTAQHYDDNQYYQSNQVTQHQGSYNGQNGQNQNQGQQMYQQQALQVDDMQRAQRERYNMEQ